MKVIGIAGGVASGKSTVADELGRLGARVLRADEAAHAALDAPGVSRVLVERWGRRILGGDGRIDRRAVSQQVFGPDRRADREFLERLIHPRVRQEMERQLEAARKEGAELVVLDIPLLLEVGWDELCDCVYFVETSWERRLERARQRGWTEEDLQRREDAQMALDEKRHRADGLLDNSGTLAELRQQIAAVWEELTASP